jgi:hypothetical protein
MIDKPLDIPDLRRAVARKAWDVYRGPSDPVDIPPSFYYAIDIVIKESYNNVDKMIADNIRRRLDGLFNST